MPELVGRESELADLSDLTVEQVRDVKDGPLASILEMTLRQVDRPRTNLGSGPPGRVD
ncbi:hypothetical protein [Actinospica robiniae]|uniref:hypothetical protein n=1 Tax=Actinospica robiniae TaxID=304901 RepID=UPI0003F4DBB2|nr:hypothetical protein [Actinospica robiniae]